jgi:CelD/BcsL family acetyltransferase involved in cellulose biosynthesis
MTVTWDVLDSVEAVEPALADWDRLGIAAGMPYSCPAWLMGWYRHAAPDGALLRVVTVRDGDELIGIGPFYAAPWRAGLWTWSLMGTDTTSRIAPLSAPGREDVVAQAIADALGTGSPAPGRVRLEGLPLDSPWPDAIRAAWPSRRRPWYHREPLTPAPVVPLDPGTDVDAFLGRRSSNFRQQMRRARRKLEKDGFAFRVASSPEEIDADLKDFERLHNARWDFRGGSTALTPGTLDMLAWTGRRLLPEGRFLLISLEREGKVINSQLFVAAGHEVSYWNGGFDDEFANYKPSMVALVEAIRLSLERGMTRFDLGPGAQEYKYRFTDDQDLLVWQTLIPPGPRYAASRAAFLPKELRHGVGKRLTVEQKRKARDLVKRAGLPV